MGSYYALSAEEVVFPLVQVHGTAKPPGCALHFPQELCYHLLHLHGHIGIRRTPLRQRRCSSSDPD